VYRSVSTLIVTFLDRFSPNGTDIKSHKSKNEFIGETTSHHPFLYLAPKTTILGQEVLKVHANIK